MGSERKGGRQGFKVLSRSFCPVSLRRLPARSRAGLLAVPRPCNLNFLRVYIDYRLYFTFPVFECIRICKRSYCFFSFRLHLFFEMSRTEHCRYMGSGKKCMVSLFTVIFASLMASALVKLSLRWYFLFLVSFYLVILNRFQ